MFQKLNQLTEKVMVERTEPVTEQIQVKYVNAPPVGEEWKASISDINGNYYNVPHVALGNFVVGEVCDITYYQKLAKNGKWYKHAQGKNNAPFVTGTAAPQTPPPRQPIMPAQPRQPIHTPPQTTQQADTAEDIFVTGIVGRSMGSGQFQITDIPLLTDAAVTAWRNRGAQINDGYLGRTTTDEPPWSEAPPHEEYPR